MFPFFLIPYIMEAEFERIKDMFLFLKSGVPLMRSSCFMTSVYSSLSTCNCKTTCSCKRDWQTIFPFQLLRIFFSCLITLARIYSIMLNPQNNGKNSYLYLVSSQKRNIHYFTIKYDISCKFFRSQVLQWPWENHSLYTSGMTLQKSGPWSPFPLSYCK